MIACKRCQSQESMKNGRIRGQQRYKCKECGLNFINGDARYKSSTAVKKALCVLLYSLGKVSFNMLGKILGHSPSIIYRWVVQEASHLEYPKIANEIKEIEFDEMWHFVQSKKTNNGLSKPWIVTAGELLPGLSAIVMLQPSKSSITN